MGKKILFAVSLIVIGASSLMSIIPNPSVRNSNIDLNEVVISERFSPESTRRFSETFPQNVLVLMVEFQDFRFEDTITNVDYLANPDYTVQDFISRFMFHLQSYYLDVSNDTYEINYIVSETLITLPRNISYYGDPAHSLSRRVQLARDVFSAVDPIINFAEYDSYIIFHSGAGKESDIYGTNPNAISSSFLNRRLLQAVLDPDNDDFPGLETEDGVYIEEFIISATNHNHPDNPENLNYGVFGLLCHLFGRQLGLPTLFGNVPALGSAAGVGNFCLMGTGVWNANGFVPPFLSAWTRMFAGWAEPANVCQSRTDLELTYPFNPEYLEIPRLYKLELTDDEYYLIENRQQNPDGSEINGQPSFTFKLLPDDEQDYYPPPFDHVPRFNFMKNTYRGCEWDFYLPGLGGPVFPEIDGSGILIWHIDDNIIRENYEINRINADPNHQGVTLQEADGIQHLRSAAPDIYMRGSPYDSFRLAHNSYFGKKEKDDGTLSIPYVQSYYGKAELEIYDVSPSMNKMIFSVNYPWSLNYDYPGKDIMSSAIIEDAQNDIYLLQPTSSGNIFFFKNFELLPDFPLVTSCIPYLYTYLEENETFIIPVQDSTNGASYYRISPQIMEQSFLEEYYEWATHPISLSDNSSDARLAISLNHLEDNNSLLYFLDLDYQLIEWFSFHDGIIASNMISRNNELLFFFKEDDGNFKLRNVNLHDYNLSDMDFQLPDDITIQATMLAPVTKEEISPGQFADNIIILTDNNYLYLFQEDGTVANGFPVSLPQEILSVPALGDITRNGYLEILLVSSNSLFVIGYNGEILNYPVPLNIDYPIETDAQLGVMAIDLNRNSTTDIIANLGGNRFVIWDKKLRIKSGYPLMLPSQPRNSPIPHFADNGLHIYLTAEKGQIYRHSFVQSGEIKRQTLQQSGWYTEFGNLQRSAYFSEPLPENQFETESIFLEEHCYAFPVPLTYENNGILYFNIMLNQNLPVQVKIFDISGKMIFKDTYDCQAYINNRNKVELDINGLSTGIYFALLSAKGETLTLKFAVER